MRSKNGFAIELISNNITRHITDRMGIDFQQGTGMSQITKL